MDRALFLFMYLSTRTINILMDHINPSYRSKSKSNNTAIDIAKRVIQKDRFALSLAITLAESTEISKKQKSTKIADYLAEHGTSQALRIAISGSPGVGKSTLIENLGLQYANSGKRVAVLAIDPSSSVTQGSILGDKTRMEALGQHENAYIRPSAAGITLGGVHHTTRESIRLCEAAGFDIILIETVGVGQSETMAAEMTDIFVLLLLPGAGDEIQGIKRGIVELADIVAINKADEDRLQLAKESAKSYRNALSLFHHPILEWRVPVAMTSGLSSKGLKELSDFIDRFHKLSKENGRFANKRIQQDIDWLHKSVHQEVGELIYNNPSIAKKLEAYKNQIIKGERSTHSLIHQLKMLIQNTYGNI